jgi:gliding motility-associated-like protein
MFRSLCLVLFVLLINTASAQQPIFQWAAQFGSSDINDTWNDNARSVAVDDQGNVYSAGLFFYDVDFNPGPGTYTMTAGGQFNEAIYISKLSPTGQFIWAKQIPTEISGPIYLTVDHHNNVYITAYVSGPVDMDPGAGVHTAQMIGPQDAFLLKLDSDGNFLWEKQFGSPGVNNGASGYAIDVDANDNVVLTGSFYGTVDLDPGAASFPITGSGSSTVFFVKLDANGNFIWGKQMGGLGGQYGYVDAEDVKCDDAGNVYSTGWFGNTCNFDPGLTNTSLTSGGPADGFVCKYDPNGNFLWVKKIGNSAANNVVQPRGIDVDVNGNVYTSGSFIGTQDVDPGNGVYNLTSNGSLDAYVLKLNSNGEFVWAKNLGGNDGDFSFDLCVGTNGNVYVLGLFYGTVDFDPGPGTSIISGLKDWSVITKFDTDGNFQYAVPFSGYNTGRRIVTDPAENIYVTGGFGGQVDFDPGPGVYNLTEIRGWTDCYVVKLSKCLNATASTLNINSCDSYILNNHKYDSSGKYIQVIPNMEGCDSVITINLAINKKFTSQTKSICESQTFYAGGANQTKAGIYIDTLKTISGCDSVITTTLVVNTKPVPDLGKDQNLCIGQQLTVSPGVFTTYAWQDGSSGNKFAINTTGAYWVTVTNSNNCSATDTIRITTVPLPSGFLKATDSVCSYETLIIRSLQNFNTYLWSTGETQNNITVSTPGQYSLKVTDANNCSATESITILPKECMYGVYLPTAFSPNGDGKNELFHPLIFGKIKKYHFAIYNRWGQTVFQTTEPNKAWDGKLAGVLQDPAIFIWTCTYQLEGSAERSQKGTVMLIR